MKSNGQHGDGLGDVRLVDVQTPGPLIHVEYSWKYTKVVLYLPVLLAQAG